MSDRALLRRRAGLTQIQLARKTAISAPRICLWERGELELRAEQVERIARVLNEHLLKVPVFNDARELAMVLNPALSCAGR